MRRLVRRLGFYLVTAWAAITINFVIPRLLPSDPVQALIARQQGALSSDAIKSLYVLFGLNKRASLWDQYRQYWGRLLHGDLGTSFAFFPTPVRTVIGQTLPWTLALVGISTVLSFVIGTLAGIAVGWRRGSLSDALLPITSFFSSIPYFWLGLLSIFFLAVTTPLFPAAGGYDSSLVPSWSLDFIGSAAYHAALPATTIVISSVAGWILGMRNMMVTVSSEDYVTVAQAKGLSESRVMFAYAARNAILPNISAFALSLGFIVGGALVTEIVFSYPGIGFALFQAIGAKDYPLMQGIFLVITLSVLVANMIADFVYIALDPRTRQEG